jgi:hypothetical protein
VLVVHAGFLNIIRAERPDRFGHGHHRAALFSMTPQHRRLAIHVAANVAALSVVAAFIAAAVKLLIIR